jgi:hypothetical protein
MWAIPSCTGRFSLPEYLVRFSLQLRARHLPTSMGLHAWIEPIELFYAELARGFGFYGGAEFLKMRADAVQCDAGFAIRTHDSTHRAPRRLNDRSKRSLIAFNPFSLRNRVPVPVKWL